MEKKFDVYEQQIATGVDGKPVVIVVPVGKFGISDLEKRKAVLEKHKARVQANIDQIDEKIAYISKPELSAETKVTFELKEVE